MEIASRNGSPLGRLLGDSPRFLGETLGADGTGRHVRGGVPLSNLRARLEAIDRQVLALLLRRRDLAVLAGCIKRRTGDGLRDESVEALVVERYVRGGQEAGLTATESKRLAKAVLAASHRAQGLAIRVAIQGGRGSYSDDAATLWAPDRALIACRAFEDAVAGLAKGEVAAAVLPIWNTMVGPLHEVLDLLDANPVQVVSLGTLPIKHALMAPRGDAGPTVIYGHPKALLQCPAALQARWPGIELRQEDAAGVADRWEREGHEPGAALLGNPRLAALHGLAVLDTEMSDVVGNATTFALLAREQP